MVGDGRGTGSVAGVDVEEGKSARVLRAYDSATPQIRTNKLGPNCQMG